MNISLRIIVFIFGLSFIIGTIKLLMKNRITERYSVFLLLGCLCVLIISIVPNLIDYIALLANIKYAPTLIFLFSTLLLFWLTLYNSIHITLLKRQIVELTQQRAVAEALNESEKQVVR